MKYNYIESSDGVINEGYIGQINHKFKQNANQKFKKHISETKWSTSESQYTESSSGPIEKSPVVHLGYPRNTRNDKINVSQWTSNVLGYTIVFGFRYGASIFH